jgi:hypothetical protein
VSEEEIRKYFRVNALRKYGYILGSPVTNQVYVHAKVRSPDPLPYFLPAFALAVWSDSRAAYV